MSRNAPKRWRIGSLLFNPVGAHPLGAWRNPNGIPNNLFPFVSQVAIGRRDQQGVWRRWPCDGSGVRDYIHVMDLAEGHLAALNCLMAEPSQLLEVNLERPRSLGARCGEVF